MPAAGEPMASAESYGADTDRLGTFVDRGRRYRAALDAVHGRVLAGRHRAIGLTGLGPDAIGAPMLAELLAAAEATDAFVESVNSALLAVALEGVRPALRQAVLDGRLPPPDDDLRSRVLAALEAGLAPDEAGIDPAYFPASVVRHHRLSRRIDELEAERDRADGLPLVWWDGDREAIASIDRRLGMLVAERASLAGAAIAGDGSVARLEGAALVAEAIGGPAWEGRVYAEAFAAHRQRALSDGGLFGHGAGALVEVRGFEAEFEHLAERVAADPEVALGFFRALGPQATADLPTFVIGADGSTGVDADERILTRLSRGLAAATRRGAGQAPGGSDLGLGFGGDDLLTQPRPATHAGVIGYTPALLLTTGRFDDRFLAQATVATLRLGAEGDPRGRTGHWGWEVSPVGFGSSRVTYDGGEDPRNILLARAAERDRSVRLVIDGLASVPGPPAPDRLGGPPDRPGPDAFDPLLRPAAPFVATSGPGWRDERHWLDRLRRPGNRRGPDEGALSPLAYPALADPYPITGFLGRVAADGEASRWLLLAVADRGSGGDRAGEQRFLGDPGTAAGLDLVLATHAAVMVDPGDLASVGLEPSGLNDGTTRPIGPTHWRAAVDQVRRWGRGQALATASTGLLAEAIGGAVDPDGRFVVARTAPFAHLAGRAEAEANDALLTYAAELDDDARRWNRLANRSAAVATTALGLVPGVGVASIPIGLGWTFLFEGKPTDAELESYRRLWKEEYETGVGLRWQAVVATGWLEHRLGRRGHATTELVVPGVGLRTVDVRRGDEPGHYRWRHRGTGGWQALVPSEGAGLLELFPHGSPTPLRRVIDGALEVGENHRDGVLARRSVDGRLGPATAENDREAIEDAGWTDRWLGDP